MSGLAVSGKMRRKRAVRRTVRYGSGSRASSGGFPQVGLNTIARMALGADLTADPSTWSWTDISDRLYWEDMVNVREGRQDTSTQVSTKSATFRAKNRDGWLSRRNPASPWRGLLSNNTPIELQIDYGTGVHTAFQGFINDFPNKFSDGLVNAWMSMRCSGALNRLQKDSNAQSPAYRASSGLTPGDFVPVDYVSCEDGTGATRFANSIPGHQPVTMAGAVTPGGYSGAIGSKSLPTLGASSQMTWILANQPNTGAAFFQCMVNFTQIPAANTTYLEIDTNPAAGSNVGRIRVVSNIVGSSLDIVSLTAAGVEIDRNGVLLSTFDLNKPRLMSVQWYTNLGTTVLGLSFYSTDTGLFDEGCILIPAGTPGTFRQVRAYGSTNNAGWATGHWAIFNDPGIINGPPIFGPNAVAFTAYDGELAVDRLNRIWREDGVPFVCTASAEMSARMGPQPIATTLDIARDCERADLGVLYEHGFGLGYLALDDRHNRPVELNVLLSQVAGDLSPADDDSRVVNVARVDRPGGSFTIAVETEGPAGTAAVGRYQAPNPSRNVWSDPQTGDVATWLVHEGTVDEDRWPDIPLQFHRNPELIPQWVNIRPYGSRMSLASVPSQMAPGRILGEIQGYSLSWNSLLWFATPSIAPATPFDVGKIASESGDADPFLGWLESDSCTPAIATTDSDTTWRINAEPLWTLATDDFPCEVVCDGELLRVEAAGDAAADTFTRVGAGFGTTTTGEVYTDSGGTVPGNYSTTGTKGQQVNDTVNAMRTSSFNVPMGLRAYVSVEVSQVATGSSLTGRLLLGTDANNYYEAQLSFRTDSTVTLQINRRFLTVGAAVASAVTIGSYIAGTQFILVLDISPGTGTAGANVVRAQWYPASLAYRQPTWRLSAEDSATISSFIWVGLASRAETGNTNVSPAVLFDNLVVCKPQLWTVTRNLNGGASAHGTSDLIELAHPIVLVP